MISGAHVIVYTKNAEADRAFFRDVLGFKSVDAGHGWLIFALPPAEAAFHPSEENGPHELYFMCDDVKAELASLAKKGVKCSEVQEQACLGRKLSFWIRAFTESLVYRGRSRSRRAAFFITVRQ
jgi:catechol 2,3-dioxygenase-like lactoylglutathione lyase family enzyme